MLGRKSFTAAEIARARGMVATAVAAAPEDAGPNLWNLLLVAVDRPFVHRVRTVTGKDTNPASELEVLVDSLIFHHGVLTPGTVVRYDPAKAVLGLAVGEPIALRRQDFVAMTAAFLGHLEAHSLEPS